jgi:putative SOS response-associated peptidase YedK
MCGRFILTTIGEIIGEEFQLPKKPDLAPRYNIAPAQPIAAVRLAENSKERELSMLRWGLIPFWAKDMNIGYRTINAKSETAAEKPAFRSAFKRRRCLIPANGFYEWKRQKGRKQKQPYLIRLKESRLFAFAGLWEQWKDADGNMIESCTILTTEPNELVAELHNRMPVILDHKDHALWLDTSVTDPEKLNPLFKAYPAEAMEYDAVSEHVNKPANDDPQCMEPI